MYLFFICIIFFFFQLLNFLYSFQHTCQYVSFRFNLIKNPPFKIFKFFSVIQNFNSQYSLRSIGILTFFNFWFYRDESEKEYLFINISSIITNDDVFSIKRYILFILAFYSFLGEMSTFMGMLINKTRKKLKEG